MFESIELNIVLTVGWKSSQELINKYFSFDRARCYTDEEITYSSIEASVKSAVITDHIQLSSKNPWLVSSSEAISVRDSKHISNEY